MINQKVEQAINNQIQIELYSSYLYLAMSVYSEGQNLKGFANWLKKQHLEEQGHAMKLVDYLLERGGTVKLQALEAPPVEFGNPVSVFEQVLKHEQHVTASIDKLYEIAIAEKDYASQIFLQWFISEQVEEEASATEILEKLKLIGDKNSGIFYFDKELAQR